MIFTDFKDKKLPMLGFGAMRLPTTPNGRIDEIRFEEMTDYAMANGVNYFDTAYPYHDGLSEIAVGKVLSKYPRESYYIADKYPGHQISDTYYPAEIFEEQLKKCGVDYFDFYLLHNIHENSIDVYLDEKWDIINYFKEQKRLGRIKHLGFSTHARLDTLRRFLDVAGDDMEFCQIQLNWMDWTLQNAKEKVELLNELNIPIWVMEPVRGGKLCKLADPAEARLAELRPNETVPGWGFRFLQGIPGITLILSGMSNMEQIKENIRTFEDLQPLNGVESAVLLDIAEQIKNSVPCTACRYCTADCPMELDIPTLIDTYNEFLFAPTFNAGMLLEGLPDDKLPSACIGCGKCEQICPQSIEISKVMKKLAAQFEVVPKWRDICRERAERAKKLK